MSATRGGGSASLDMADFPGSDDRGTSLNGNESSAFGVNGRALDAPAAEAVNLFAAEGERAVAYLCTSGRPMTFADADALVERAFAHARDRPDSRRFSRPAIFAFVTLQQGLSAHRPSDAGQSADAVAQSTAAAANRPDIARLVALQNALDQLPLQQRQVVVLRELSR
ncbi:MAG TPA: hypothetical protein VHN80_07650, partial [Kineosporiaceae bacterium]|nr:hypothetical protein [Kineosporiaceae bacterium]